MVKLLRADDVTLDLVWGANFRWLLLGGLLYCWVVRACLGVRL